MLDADKTRIEISGALSQLLSHLDNNVGTVETLLSTMLGSRDQWLRHVVGNPASALLREDLESLLTAVIERALGSLATAFPERFRGETIKLARFAAGNLAQGRPRKRAG